MEERDCDRRGDHDDERTTASATPGIATGDQRRARRVVAGVRGDSRAEADSCGVNPWFDAGVYIVPFVLASLACARRAARHPAERAAWRALAAGMVLFACGNLYSSVALATAR
jgi:hypothetical protein